MSGIRVIGGSVRGRRLSLVPGDSTRPITDRVKENLFNILGRRVVGASVLDLFAGTGGVGIEALSRGAASARFLDINHNAILTIRENLKTTGFVGQSEVMRLDAFSLLAKPPDRVFDLIYLAPPQYKTLWSRALLELDKNPGWLGSGATVVAQIDPREEEPVGLVHLKDFDRRRYGNTLLLFYGIE